MPVSPGIGKFSILKIYSNGSAIRFASDDCGNIPKMVSGRVVATEMVSSEPWIRYLNYEQNVNNQSKDDQTLVQLT